MADEVNHIDFESSFGRFLLRFVTESNGIEDVSIPQRALVESWREGSGHMGAAGHMLELAERHAPITIQHLCNWQRAITQEQLRYGHWIADREIGVLRQRTIHLKGFRFADPEVIQVKLDALLTEINSGVASDSENVLTLAARTHWAFELIHPFADGNGRTGRLLSLYVLRTRRVRPVLFTADDRSAWYGRAFGPLSPEAMIAYFSGHQLDADPWHVSPATRPF